MIPTVRSSSVLAPQLLARPAWRVAALAVFIWGCTASWNALVRYSDQPAPPGQGVEQGVYAAVLRGYLDPHMPETTVLTPPDSVVGELAALTTGRPLRIPHHWADTLRTAIEVALADPSLRQSASEQLVVQAAERVGLNLIPSRDFHPVSQGAGARRATAARLWLSRPGFNVDSTIAVVRVTYWCGMLCAHGITLALARRPGHEWRVWNTWLHWVS